MLTDICIIVWVRVHAWIPECMLYNQEPGSHCGNHVHYLTLQVGTILFLITYQLNDVNCVVLGSMIWKLQCFV